MIQDVNKRNVDGWKINIVINTKLFKMGFDFVRKQMRFNLSIKIPD